MKTLSESDIIIKGKKQEPYAKLYCYASGDGSLSFNWAEVKHPMPSINKEVTREQVEKYLSENAHLKKTHFISERWNQIHLIPRVYRVGKGKLKYKGDVYEVSPAYYTDSEGRQRLSRSETKITFTYPENHPLGAEPFEVKNISIRAALFYYLENRRWRYRHLEFTPKRRGEYMTVNACVIRFNPYWKEYNTSCKISNYPGESFKTKADAIDHCKRWKRSS